MRYSNRTDTGRQPPTPPREPCLPDHTYGHERKGWSPSLATFLHPTGRKTGDSTAEYERWWRHALADLPADDYPLTHAAAGFLPTSPREDQFLWGLEQILGGLRAFHPADDVSPRAR